MSLFDSDSTLAPAIPRPAAAATPFALRAAPGFGRRLLRSRGGSDVRKSAAGIAAVVRRPRAGEEVSR